MYLKASFALSGRIVGCRIVGHRQPSRCGGCRQPVRYNPSTSNSLGNGVGEIAPVMSRSQQLDENGWSSEVDVPPVIIAASRKPTRVGLNRFGGGWWRPLLPTLVSRCRDHRPTEFVVKGNDGVRFSAGCARSTASRLRVPPSSSFVRATAACNNADSLSPTHRSDPSRPPAPGLP